MTNRLDKVTLDFAKLTRFQDIFQVELQVFREKVQRGLKRTTVEGRN